MANLKTKYLGMELKSPLIVGACSLTDEPEKLKALEDAGAGAIVFKTLFEEQIQLEELELNSELAEFSELHAEMTKIFPTMKHAGPTEHLLKLKKAKQAVSIPVIASLNAVFMDTWVEYAKLIEQTGVDALEINFYTTPKDFELEGKDIIATHLEVLNKVVRAVKIPITVKLSPFYTNPLHVVSRMDKTGVEGFVMFNRMFQPDIDIETEHLEQTIMLSSSHDARLSVRFTGLLYGNIAADICSASGILTGEDAIKTMLAGANAFQVVSALYQKDIKSIGTILNDISNWMDRKGYNTIDDFKGKLAKVNLKDPFAYRRAQYVEILMHSHDVLKKTKL